MLRISQPGKTSLVPHTPSTLAGKCNHLLFSSLIDVPPLMQGPQPQILYCQHGGTSVRLVYTVMLPAVLRQLATVSVNALLLL